jgi:hypothetical protein
MVKGLLIGLWLGLALTGTAAIADNYRLWLQPAADTPRQAELGQPLTLLLWYQGPADLDRIDTSVWDKDFAVARGYASRTEQGQRLRLRLTPRRTGMLLLPPLQLASATSAVQQIQVSAAREGDMLLDPHWSLSTSQAWQRQELIASLTVVIADRTAHLDLRAFHPQGTAVTALPTQTRTLADGRQRLRYSWLLRPLAAGTVTINAPVLRYIRDGVPRRRFHFPHTRVKVRSLPPYVPPTIPVGILTASKTPGGPLHAQGVGAAALTAALQRAGLPATALQRQDGGQGTVSEARIDWARAQPSAAGVVSFDPRRGRLRAVHLQPPPAPWWLMGGLPLAILLLLILWQRRRLLHFLRLWDYRRRLRGRLAQARSAEDQASALLALPLPDTTMPQRTLSEWVTGYCQLYGLPTHHGETLSRCVAMLDNARFSRAATSGDELQQLPRLL